MWSLSLFAQLIAADRDDPMTRPEMIWGLVGLTGSLLVGAAVIYMVDKWRKRAEAASSDDGAASLTSFRAMYESGEITEAEYAELRRKVAEKVKNTPVPKAPDAPTPPGPGGMPKPPVFPSPSNSSPSPAGPTDSPPPPPSN